MNLSSLLPAPQSMLPTICGTALVAAVGFAAGWTVNGWRLGEELQSIQRQHAEQQTKDTQVANAAFLEQQQARQRLENTLSLQEQQHYGELQHAQTTAERLSADLAAARQRMRITITAGSCRQLSGAGKAAGPGSVDDGAVTADIQPATAADLARLAGDADACAVKLTALQDWAREIIKTN